MCLVVETHFCILSFEPVVGVLLICPWYVQMSLSFIQLCSVLVYHRYANISPWRIRT